MTTDSTPFDKEALLRDADACLTKTYSKPPILFVRGKGCYLYDSDGNRYLDFTSGIAVNALGHCHPALTRALQEQAGLLMHTSNMFGHPWEALLAKKLVSTSFAKRVFFANSGTEANEGALKTARLYASRKYGPKKFEIVSTLESFHGRTCGSLSVTGREKYRQGIEPLIPGVRFIRYNDCEALEKNLTENTCAFIVEPIQGEAGVFPATNEFLRLARQLTEQRDIILIFDEVQVGLGRTGKLFCYEHYGITPDIMTLAKGLGGGFPIGAILFSEKTAQTLQVGNHASTFGGNPFGCRAALTVFETIERDALIANATAVGAHLQERLREIANKTKRIKEIRGQGLLVAAELTEAVTPIANQLREKENVLVNRILPNTIRVIPPLIVTTEEIDNFADALLRCLET